MGLNDSIARRHAQQRKNPKRARSKNITISEGDEKTEASLGNIVMSKGPRFTSL